MAIQTQHVDLLVLGGGLSGLSTAMHACEMAGGNDFSVLVIEKTEALGGSSQYSSGMFWAPKDKSMAHETIQYGEHGLIDKLIDGHRSAVDWFRTQGLRVSDEFPGIMSIGLGYPIDIKALTQLAIDKIRARSTAKILLNTSAISLLQDYRSGPVRGAIILPDGGEPIEVHAKTTVISMGGFQGSPKLVSRYIGPGADNIFVRSNRGNTGDGLSLASKAGAGSSRGMSTFYGHLLPSPLQASEVDPFQFLHIAQFQSSRTVLVNRRGKRFCDETMGDEVSNQAVAQQENRIAYMILSDEAREKYATGEPWPNAGFVDRIQKAKDVGGRVFKVKTVEGLVQGLATWGVAATNLKNTIQGYNTAARLLESGSKVDPSNLDAPIGTNEYGKPPHGPITDDNGPFWALEVQPSITLTYGGTKINSSSQALTQNGRAIENLYVTGVDAGGFSNYRYCAGLALAWVTGKWAGEAAVGGR
ncbi:hypothetical protein LTR84_004452 [Exophiala bonariae]|uniref:FAD-dependent oxidoreductase 2 FAD-binding domain-containing protein n=1 Tax=Exophiala bonariae TaxID=1690606 RepID=A0AAV9N5X4_9EURO|nr:hypothetical protein LTR84_004452 [Exophiala bonariae]